MALEKLLEQIDELTTVTELAAIKKLVKASYQWLDDGLARTNIETLVFGRAHFVDALLVKLWRLSGLHQIPGHTLIAVGGYGRGQLQPYSDIDLLLLTAKPLNEQQSQAVSEFITLLWDTGLDIGQSVRTIKETITQARVDVTIATNLIESRRLAGSESSFKKLHAKMRGKSFWSSKEFFKAKYQEQLNRHAKFHGTAYNLEPNVKENPGCLRDIQNIGWVAKKHFNVFSGSELVEHGYFTQSELKELQDSRLFLWRIRCALHLVAGRSENRLLFDYQTDVAQRLGYGEEGKASVEAMMKAFFRQVRRISELNQMLLQRFGQEILGIGQTMGMSINQDFELYNGCIKPLHQAVFPSPVAILQFLHLVATRPDIQGIDTDTLRQLRNARRAFSDHYWCEDTLCRQQFMQLMANPHFFDLGWELMHKHGILQAYLPQWDHIVGMMQFDLFHAYTVDEHTYRLVNHIRSYYRKTEQAFPRCHKIVQESDNAELLFIAGIFHDIAKGQGGDHSKLGAEDMAAFCQSHQLSEQDSQLLCWLVENHLLMSVVAQRRDIYDPEVVADFAAKVKSKQHLKFLYALTLADIRATNDNLWNDWKASLLKELYLMTHKALDNGLECKSTMQQRADQHQQVAMQHLLVQGFNGDSVLALWDQFDDDYFTRFNGNQIAWHSKVILTAKASGNNELVIEIDNKINRAGTELILYGKDKFSLFAQVASVLDSRNCSIHDAQITSLSNGFVFDSFILLEQDGSPIDSASRISAIKAAIQTQLEKPGDKHTNSRRISRQHKQLQVPTKVRFYPGRSGNTLLELEALDTPGLLARVSRILMDMQLSLHMAKITTIGERAEDLFIISTLDEKALSADQQVALKKQLIEELNAVEAAIQ